jgi:hypothetical protein
MPDLNKDIVVQPSWADIGYSKFIDRPLVGENDFSDTGLKIASVTDPSNTLLPQVDITLDPLQLDDTLSDGAEAIPTAIKSAFVFTIVGTLSVTNSAAPTLVATTDVTLTEIYVRLRTASSSGSVAFRINNNGSAISTVSIGSGYLTGSTTLAGLTMTKNDRLDIDVTSAGTGAADASVFVRATNPTVQT